MITSVTTDLETLRGQKFGTIYADPPWNYSDQNTRAATSNHYVTMNPGDICRLPVRDLAADNCHLHLWATASFLPDGLEVLKAWGFRYVTNFVWVKRQMGIGHYWRMSHEHLLLGVRGRMSARNRSQWSWMLHDRLQHSEKPEQVRKSVELLSTGPYLEFRPAFPDEIHSRSHAEALSD